MGRYLTAIVIVASAACASPVAPTVPDAPPAVQVDPAVLPAWLMLRAMPSAPWANGEPVAAWLDRLPLTEIRAEDLGPGYGALYRGAGTIVVSTDLLRDTTAAVAGYLAHEARHAEGYAHDCDPYRDWASTPWGPWRVHQQVLVWAGDTTRALSLNDSLCD